MSKVFLFNPYTGTPRHPADIKSDPEGLAIVDPAEPLRACKPKRCEACRSVGMVHCSDPQNCGGPWSDAALRGEAGRS